MSTDPSSPDSVSVDLSGVINLPAATETTDGLVELADVEETRAGVDNTQAVTPASAAATYLAIAEFTAKGDLLTATGQGEQCALPVGLNSQVLTACDASDTGLCWTDLPTPVPAIPCSLLNGKGALVIGEAQGIPAALSAGSNGQFLVACDLAPFGVSWVTVPPTFISCSVISGKGAILTGTSPNVPTALPVGTNGQYLVACSLSSTGLCWETPVPPVPSIPCSIISGKGALVVGSETATPTALPRGVDGQVLHANAACPAGLEWKNSQTGGRTVCALAAPGVVAVTMDNLRICFTTAGNRTWAFSTVTGTSIAIAQTTSASDVTLSTQRRVATLSSTSFSELGWNFTCAASCATYLICMGPLNNPNAIYCFVGMTGCNYINNFFSLTRLF